MKDCGRQNSSDHAADDSSSKKRWQSRHDDPGALIVTRPPRHCMILAKIEAEQMWVKCKRSAEALQIVCAESCEHRKKSHLLQGCSQWTTIRTT
jgi:hypothetical protein